MLKAGGVTYEDVLVDLGAGARRLCLFISHFFPIHVVAFEINPVFTRYLSVIKETLNIEKLEVVKGDFRQDPLPAGTVYYLCQLFLTEEELQILVQKLSQHASGSKVISVGLNFEHPNFLLYHTEKGSFLWGNTEVYYYFIR